MASKAIKGITIEIGGNTTKLDKALSDSTKKSQSLQKELSAVNKALKFNPDSVELLTQKQDLLNERIEATSDQLRILKDAQSQVQAQFESGEIGAEQYRAFQREIVETESKLNNFTSQLEDTNNRLSVLQNGTNETVSEFDKLTNTIDEQQAELEDLADQYTEVILSQGKGSDEAKALASRISSLNTELQDNKDRLNDAESKAKQLASALDDTGQGAENSRGGFTIMKGALADLTANAIQSCISAIGDFIGSLFELSEATEEYRQMQAKLEGSATSFGYSIEFANEKYKEFYTYIGDDQMATNAITNLMGLGLETSNLEGLVDGAIATWSAYGDSIPIESLTESIAESINVGQVTGTLADTINWASLSNEKWNNILGEGSEAQKAFNKAISEGESVEDAFSSALASTSDAQERSNLVAGLLNETYGDSRTTYDQLAGSILDANEAELELKDTQADLGETIAPVNTAITDLKNKALEAILPVIESVVQAFLDLSKWLEENPEKAKVLQAVLIGLATAFGTLAVAMGIQSLIKGVTTAFQALNAVMKGNVFILVASLIAGLVTAFITLWNTSEDFRNFWINLWDTISSFVSSAVDSIVGFFTGLGDTIYETFSGIWSSIQDAWSGVTEWFSELVENIKTFFSDLWTSIQEIWTGVGEWFSTNVIEPIKEFFTPFVEWFLALFTSIKDFVVSVFEVIAQLAVGCWNTIQLVWSVVAEWFNANIVQPLVTFFTGLWTSITTLASNAWNGIVMIWTVVSTWFNTYIITPLTTFFTTLWTTITSLASDAWNGIVGIWTTVSTWFTTTVIDPVVNTFTGLWDKLKSGASGAWEGIKSVFNSVTSFFRSTFESAWTAVKNVFSTGGKIFDGIKDGIVNGFKAIVNAIIGGINKAIATPFNAINSALKTIKNFSILGQKPFKGLISTISVPKIPKLATGGFATGDTLANIGEDGREVVLPLDKNLSWADIMAEHLVSRMQNLFNNIDLIPDVNVPLEFNGSNFDRALENTFSKAQQNNTTLRELVELAQEYFPRFIEASKRQIVLDNGTLIGESIDLIDSKLGELSDFKDRGG